ncbi:Protein of unknown function [Pedobacter terrae]|uniref:DUF4435 domain-containing protein n=1 Tax=Pedobacter terrae TaxID=405671 RepID=A0A1G7VIX9_9SPHI|nr:DUF4435 domain-containing protein [Pedobacter terrae]SDG59694.1 Protein of unknown function [Pedobacter terrae]
MTTEDFFDKKFKILPRASNLSLKQAYSRSGNDLHVYVEDRDDFEFYRTWIKYIYRDYLIKPYYQKGKSNVLKAYKEVDWSKYSKSKVLFFMDKDYDDVLKREIDNDENIFYTKYYSIENYLINNEALEIIFTNFHNIDTEKIMSFLIDEFNKSYDIFVKFIDAITPFILIYRETQAHLVLKDLKLPSFVSFFDLELVYKRYAEKYDHQRITKAASSTKREKASLRELTLLSSLNKQCEADISHFKFSKLMSFKKKLKAINDPKIYIRGKFELWFLLQYLDNIEKALYKQFAKPNKEALFGNKVSYPKRKTVLNESNIFDILANKLTMPQDISDFLNNNYNKVNVYN